MANWGQIGFLTESQELCLNEFLGKANPSHVEASKYSAETNEQLGCRFLRARNFEVDKSLILLSEAYQVLNEYHADDCTKLGPDLCAGCDEKVLKSFYPHNQQGYDRLGRLILYEHNGGANMNAIRHITTPQMMVKYHFWTMEKVLDELFIRSPRDPARRKVVSTLAVCDFESLGLGHLTPSLFDHLKILIKLDNICYPEMLGKMVIINAPSLAVGFYNMIKGWLDPRTQRKIELYGSGPEAFKRLRELISVDQLPKMYGGNAPDPYFMKPNTEYVAVPRDGELKRTIKVKYSLSLHVIENFPLIKKNIYVH
jgi:hypothetical protein